MEFLKKPVKIAKEEKSEELPPITLEEVLENRELMNSLEDIFYKKFNVFRLFTPAEEPPGKLMPIVQIGLLVVILLVSFFK